MQTHWKGVRLAGSMMILLAVILLPVSAAPGDYLPGDLDLSFAGGAGRRITAPADAGCTTQNEPSNGVVPRAVREAFQTRARGTRGSVIKP